MLQNKTELGMAMWEERKTIGRVHAASLPCLTRPLTLCTMVSHLCPRVEYFGWATISRAKAWVLRRDTTLPPYRGFEQGLGAQRADHKVRTLKKSLRKPLKTLNTVQNANDKCHLPTFRPKLRRLKASLNVVLTSNGHIRSYKHSTSRTMDKEGVAFKGCIDHAGNANPHTIVAKNKTGEIKRPDSTARQCAFKDALQTLPRKSPETGVHGPLNTTRVRHFTVDNVEAGQVFIKLTHTRVPEVVPSESRAPQHSSGTAKCVMLGAITDLFVDSS
jgi:hypothetical protein|mmetsp:Transcript_71229/g.119152  ORF Transcript_71229/g.119152 Transcript_71229/m.119152 type:complete len:274 (-) Transcript_71229:873-1694(-)